MAPRQEPEIGQEREVPLGLRREQEGDGPGRLGVEGVAEHAEEGRDADPGADEDDRAAPLGIDERPARTLHAERHPGSDRGVEEARDLALLPDRDLEVPLRRRGGADRVTAGEVLPVEVDFDHRELAGLELEPGRADEPERPNLGSLGEDREDLDLLEARPGPGSRGGAAGWWTGRRRRFRRGDRRDSGRDELLAGGEPEHVRRQDHAQPEIRGEEPGRHGEDERWEEDEAGSSLRMAPVFPEDREGAMKGRHERQQRRPGLGPGHRKHPPEVPRHLSNTPLMQYPDLCGAQPDGTRLTSE